jgi:hypothetical protein
VNAELPERPRVRHVLLLVQAATIACLALESLVLGGPRALGVLTAATGLIPLGVSLGLLRGRAWARFLGLLYESCAVLAGVLNVLVLRNNDLVSVLLTLAIPAWLLWSLIVLAKSPYRASS